MHRTFKFRAYELIEKRMFTVNALDNTGDYDRIWQARGEGESSFSPNIVLMQFIGILDSLTIPIYEGDIVAKNGKKAVVQWDSTYACFVLKGKDWETNTIIGNELIILGNIYENKDLWEK